VLSRQVSRCGDWERSQDGLSPLGSPVKLPDYRQTLIGMLRDKTALGP
jgi:hypothetical protein